jgi:hypothetical protein
MFETDGSSRSVGLSRFERGGESLMAAKKKAAKKKVAKKAPKKKVAKKKK